MRRSPSPLWVTTRNHPWPLSTSCTCTCTRTIRCWKARFRLRAWPTSPRPTSRRRWRSPTPTTCSVCWNSPKNSQAPASSRSSAARSPSISATPTTAPATPMRRPRASASCCLAAREAGYRSLMRLSSRAFLDTPPNEPPRLKLEWLEGETDGIIALTGGPGGPLDSAIAAGQSHLATTRLDALHRLFGDRLYVELQRHGTAQERMTEPVLIDLAYGKGLPLVATNEPYFATAADHEAHDALICIAEGRLLAESDRRQLNAEHRFKSRAEMVALFADLPEALASTVEIAERCAFRPHTHQPILPRFSVGDSDEASELRKRAEAGLARRLASAGRRARPQRGGIPRAARFRTRRHRRHEISRLLPDRRRFHPVGEGEGHSGRPRPRFRRRLAGVLCAHHHRPRSDPLRAAVRALSQSRARVDAGLRHRLLPGPPRRGDPLRAGALRPRPGGADHHLRHVAGARRAARRRPRAADALRAGRQAVQAGAAEPDRSGHARASHRGRAETTGRARRRSGGQARLRHRAASSKA